MPSIIRLHRVLRAAPERVYRAFPDADAIDGKRGQCKIFATRKARAAKKLH